MRFKALIALFICLVAFTTSCANLRMNGLSGQLLDTAERKFFENKKLIDLLQQPVVENAQLSAYLNSLMKKIAKRYGVTDPPRVVVADTPFAQGMTDYSNVYISRGMLYAIGNEAQLVALLAHEFGHIRLHHDEEPASGDSDAVASVVGSITGSSIAERETYDVVAAQFEQKKETAADEFGAKTARDLGYNPYQFANLFETLWKQSGLGTIATIKALKDTHKTLKGRAESIKAYLKRQGFANTGNIADEPYRKMVQPIVEKPDSSAVSAQDNLKKLTRELKARHKKLTIPEFISYMEKARALGKDLGALDKLAHFNKSGKTNSFFLTDTIKVQSPCWEDATSVAFKDFLNVIAHVGIGAVPVIGDSVDLYEVVSGKDFITGDQLSFEQRVISSLGLLVGSGSEWRGVATNLEEAAEKETVGIAKAAEASTAMKEAEDFAKEGQLYGKSKVGYSYNVHFEERPLQKLNAMDSFMGGKYTEITPIPGEKFYRVGGPSGEYWSRVEPTSKIRSMSENAIPQEWNDFSQKSVLEIPHGFDGKMYEGISGNMSGKILKSGKQIPSGSIFHGGGNQVFIPPETLSKIIPYIKTGAL